MAGQSVWAGCGFEFMSWTLESLLTIVTRLPTGTRMLLGVTAPPLEIVMVVVSTSWPVGVGDVGVEPSSPPPHADASIIRIATGHSFFSPIIVSSRGRCVCLLQ